MLETKLTITFRENCNNADDTADAIQRKKEIIESKKGEKANETPLESKLR